MANLPESITALAYRATNGELAWRRADVPAALAAITASGQAILGGEVWLAEGEGQWCGLMPAARGGLPAVWHWETTARASGESWPAYCRRTAEESAHIVALMAIEEAAPSVRDCLFFNLTYLAECGT
jgi:hypothetical protein